MDLINLKYKYAWKEILKKSFTLEKLGVNKNDSNSNELIFDESFSFFSKLKEIIIGAEKIYNGKIKIIKENIENEKNSKSDTYDSLFKGDFSVIYIKIIVQKNKFTKIYK